MLDRRQHREGRPRTESHRPWKRGADICRLRHPCNPGGAPGSPSRFPGWAARLQFEAGAGYEPSLDTSGAWRHSPGEDLRGSQEVLEIAFYPQAAADAENMRRDAGRIELHEVARAVPDVMRTGQQIVGLVWPV